MAGARSTWGLYRVDLGRGQLVSAWRGTLRTVPWHRLLPGPGHPLLLPIVQGWGRGLWFLGEDGSLWHRGYSYISIRTTDALGLRSSWVTWLV